jgi:hypothetical protein
VRILITTGEPSGDLLASRVVTALRARLPDAEIEAVGGPHLAAAGATIRRSITGLSTSFRLTTRSGATCALISGADATTSSLSSTIPASICAWRKRRVTRAFPYSGMSHRSSGPGIRDVPGGSLVLSIAWP